MKPAFNAAPARRAFLTSTALVAPAFVAGCANLSPGAVSSVEQVIAKIQAAMPYISGIVSVIGIVVPGVTTGVNLVQQSLSAASNVFASLTSTMSTTQAQPVVAALPPPQQAQATTLLAEAQTILGDLNAFAGLVSAPAYLARATLPTHLFVRAVK
jgi:hypothetical protein